MYNPFSLQGKTIFVTGASSGIGKATAIECSKNGARVVIIGRNENRLQETFNELAENEFEHIKFVLDITVEASVNSMIEKLPKLDGIVHAAGIANTTPFQFLEKRKMSEIFDINFFSPVVLTKSLVKMKKISRGGSIVFISSIDGPITGHIGNSIYAATKGAISAIIKSMAVELAVKNIRVNSVLPGQIETPLIYGGKISEEQLNNDKQLYPLKRYGDPREVAMAIVYFLSDASTFTTGTGLIIDGGFTLV